MNQRKIVQIASIPERVDSLKLTVESVIDQCSIMQIALNGYSEPPPFLLGNPKISTILSSNDMTDANKALHVEDKEGYIFFLDDDIVVPPTYISDMVDAINKYKCIVSLHGKVFRKPFKSFYHIEKNYRCLGNVPAGGYVDCVGSGIMGYHTDHFKLSYCDLKTPNMADIHISVAAHKQGVKIYILPHTENYLKHIRHDDNLFVQENKKGFVEQTNLLREMFNG